MTPTKAKERRVQLASDVRRANNEAAFAIKDLVRLLIDDAKDKLLSSSGDDTLRLQGEAQGFIRLHEMITTEPSEIKREKGK